MLAGHGASLTRDKSNLCKHACRTLIIYRVINFSATVSDNLCVDEDLALLAEAGYSGRVLAQAVGSMEFFHLYELL